MHPLHRSRAHPSHSQPLLSHPTLAPGPVSPAWSFWRAYNQANKQQYSQSAWYSTIIKLAFLENLEINEATHYLSITPCLGKKKKKLVWLFTSGEENEREVTSYRVKTLVLNHLLWTQLSGAAQGFCVWEHNSKLKHFISRCCAAPLSSGLRIPVFSHIHLE